MMKTNCMDAFRDALGALSLAERRSELNRRIIVPSALPDSPSRESCARGRALLKRDSATRRGRRRERMSPEQRAAYSQRAHKARGRALLKYDSATRRDKHRERMSLEQRAAYSQGAHKRTREYMKAKARARDRKRRARSDTGHKPRRAKLIANRSCASVNRTIDASPHSSLSTSHHVNSPAHVQTSAVTLVLSAARNNGKFGTDQSSWIAGASKQLSPQARADCIRLYA